jgi:hypothetical protein
MSVKLAPLWIATRFADSNNNLLASGQIWTYVAGSTSVQAETWSDSGGTSPNPNPIVLDSSGLNSTEIWLLEGNYYNFVLRDSNGNTIVSADDVSAPSGGGGGGSPGSPVNSIQFNSAGSFGGSNLLKWDGVQNAIRLGDGFTSGAEITDVSSYTAAIVVSMSGTYSGTTTLNIESVTSGVVSVNDFIVDAEFVLQPVQITGFGTFDGTSGTVFLSQNLSTTDGPYFVLSSSDGSYGITLLTESSWQGGEIIIQGGQGAQLASNIVIEGGTTGANSTNFSAGSGDVDIIGGTMNGPAPAGAVNISGGNNYFSGDALPYGGDVNIAGGGQYSMDARGGNVNIYTGQNYYNPTISANQGSINFYTNTSGGCGGETVAYAILGGGDWQIGGFSGNPGDIFTSSGSNALASWQTPRFLAPVTALQAPQTIASTTTETYASYDWELFAGSYNPGQVFEVIVAMQAEAAAAQTVTLRARFGPNATVADTLLGTATFTTPGSSGTAYYTFRCYITLEGYWTARGQWDANGQSAPTTGPQSFSASANNTIGVTVQNGDASLTTKINQLIVRPL